MDALFIFIYIIGILASIAIMIVNLYAEYKVVRIKDLSPIFIESIFSWITFVTQLWKYIFVINGNKRIL